MSASIRHWDKTGNTQIFSFDWGSIFTGASGTPTKFYVENNGTRTLTNLVAAITQVGTSDGNTIAVIARDIDSTTPSVLPPYGVTAVANIGAGTGAFSATGTWYYRITALNALGETVGSTEVSATITSTTDTITLNWTVSGGTTSYKIYRANVTGSLYATPAFLAAVSPGTTHVYMDTGIAVTSPGIPQANTTGGAAPNYGSAPGLGTASLAIGNLVVDQQYAYWVNSVIPSGMTEANNPRLFRIAFTES